MKESKALEIAKKLRGMHTVNTIMKKMGVSRSTAIKTVHELRKKGLVKTSGGGKKPRLYRIYTVPQVKVGGRGLYDTINKYSRIKLAAPYKHRISGRDMSVEEAIARAAASGSIRTIMASLDLFNHVKDWPLLYHYAKKYNVRRKVGALYDTARTAVKTRRMDERIRKRLKKGGEGRFMVRNMKSDDFIDIQKEWKVYVPLNKADLHRYKE